MHNVKDFGAAGNGCSNDRAAIQSAINACSEAGGGTVFFPAGKYLTGTLYLANDIIIYLDAGAILLSSKDPNDFDGDRSGPYFRSHLIIAKGVKNTGILGKGTIQGQGKEEYISFWEKLSFRAGITLFEDCSNITIKDITILYSDMWTLHLRRCDRVYIDGITILNNIRRYNSDGIDPDSCSNVHISNCHIVAGDDCIVLKTHDGHPCQNIVISNCTFETTCTALKLGTESEGDFRNIHISNCTIRYVATGLGMYVKDGAVMERITFSNISIERLEIEGVNKHDFPILLDIEKRREESPVGSIRDVIFRDILINNGSGILAQGMQECPIENIVFQNILLRTGKGVSYEGRKKHIGGRRAYQDERDECFASQPSFMTLAHVKGVLVENFRLMISPEFPVEHERYAFYGFNIQESDIRYIGRLPEAGHDGMQRIKLDNCTSVRVMGCEDENETVSALKLKL